MPTIRMKVIPMGVREEYWWTDDFDKMKVFPVWKRLLLCPVYILLIMHLCLKGVPTKVILNYNITLSTKEASP